MIRTFVSAGASWALASLNLPAQAAHSARLNLAPSLRDMKRVLNEVTVQELSKITSICFIWRGKYD
jgi:hypothetical protein